jgi:hypothetical protein
LPVAPRAISFRAGFGVGSGLKVGVGGTGVFGGLAVVVAALVFGTLVIITGVFVATGLTLVIATVVGSMTAKVAGVTVGTGVGGRRVSVGSGARVGVAVATGVSTSTIPSEVGVGLNTGLPLRLHPASIRPSTVTQHNNENLFIVAGFMEKILCQNDTAHIIAHDI